MEALHILHAVSAAQRVDSRRTYWRNKQPAGSDCAACRVLYARAYVIDVLIKHTCVPFCLLGSGRVHAQLIGHGRRPGLGLVLVLVDVHDRFPGPAAASPNCNGAGIQLYGVCAVACLLA